MRGAYRLQSLQNDNAKDQAMTKRKDASGDVVPVTLNLRVELDALKGAIAAVMPAGSVRRVVFPALTCITLRGLGDEVEVAYTGVDHASRVRIPGAGAGGLLLPIRALNAFVLGARGEVTMTKGEADEMVTLADGHGFTLKAVPLAGADLMASIIDRFHGSNENPGNSFALGDGVLADLLAFCSPFISNEETRYYLNGVCLAFEDEGASLRAVATDGHRMGARRVQLPAKWQGPLGGTHIVPRDLVTLVQRHAAGKEVKVTLYAAPFDVAVFEIAGGLTIGGRLIEGSFPDWRRVVPGRSEDFVEVDVADAKRVLKAFKPFSTDRGGNAVRIHLEGKSVTFSASNPDTGELHATVDGNASGDIEDYRFEGIAGLNRTEKKGEGRAPTDFGLNYRYLAGMLDVLGRTTKRARLLVKSSGHPIRLEPAGEPGDDILILMPMRV